MGKQLAIVINDALNRLGAATPQQRAQSLQLAARIAAIDPQRLEAITAGQVEPDAGEVSALAVALHDHASTFYLAARKDAQAAIEQPPPIDFFEYPPPAQVEPDDIDEPAAEAIDPQ